MLLGTIGRLRAAARPALAAAGLAAGFTALSSYPPLRVSAEESPAAAEWQRSDKKDLPIFTRAEVAKHASAEAGIWVTFRGGVYDITQFVQNHPGGTDKIMSAAGGAVEPYWSLYRQHLMPVAKGDPGSGPVPKPAVCEILAPMQIGRLDPAEEATEKAERAEDDPFRDEPERHPALRLLSETPCSAETPRQLIADSWITPGALWFVRNHHPVPKIEAEQYALEVDGPGLAAPRSFSLAELKAMPSATVTATLQCGGNRRDGLNTVRKTSGIAWGIGAISTGSFTGVRLRDVMVAAGVLPLSDAGCGAGAEGGDGGAAAEGGAAGTVAHVQFEGVDGTRASIPVEKAASRRGDVLLAYELNGEPLPPDHGYPLRAVVPGHVGIRNIKWLQRVTASAEEATGVWQRGMAYKHFGPSVTSLEGVDVAAAASMQEMPVQSAILDPLPEATVDGGEDLTVRGFAWSGGGRGIVRVDVSADNGETWKSAELTQGAEQPLDRAWAWTFWEVELPISDSAAAPTTLVCKAVDAAHNSQPETPSAVWNLRGLANNSWHRVPIRVLLDEAEDAARADTADVRGYETRPSGTGREDKSQQAGPTPNLTVTPNLEGSTPRHGGAFHTKC